MPIDGRKVGEWDKSEWFEDTFLVLFSYKYNKAICPGMW